MIVYKSRGFVCIIRQVEGMGHLCGYIVTPMNHKLNKEQYNHASYHVIGFDCNHSFDYSPLLNFGNPKDYKNVDYVKNEIEVIIDQLLEIDSLNVLSNDSVKLLCDDIVINY